MYVRYHTRSKRIRIGACCQFFWKRTDLLIKIRCITTHYKSQYNFPLTKYLKKGNETGASVKSPFFLLIKLKNVGRNQLIQQTNNYTHHKVHVTILKPQTKKPNHYQNNINISTCLHLATLAVNILY